MSVLLDLEFLCDPASKRRVAAFGYHVGFTCAALAIEKWTSQIDHPESPFPSVSSCSDEDALIADVKRAATREIAEVGMMSKVIIVGALGDLVKVLKIFD